MPYNQQHMLFQWGGPFAQSGGEAVDEFVGSMRFAGPGINEADNDEVAEDLLADLLTFWTNQANWISSFARIGWAKWNRIGVDGRYVSSTSTRIVFPTSNTPGGALAGYPLQVAWAATWTTDAARGRASKGRTFWPISVPVVVGDNLRVQGARCQAFAAANVALIGAWNSTLNDAGSSLVAQVMSDIGEGRSGPILGCRVGNRLDIQRRRDNKLDETYYQAGIAPGGR